MGKAWEHSSREWRQVDVRWTWGGGAQLPKLCTGSSVQALYRIFGLQTLAWWKLLVLNGKKLPFKFSMNIFEYRPLPPYIHLTSTHVMNAPRPSPFFTGLPLPCIIVNANERKNRTGKEATLYTPSPPITPLHVQRSPSFHCLSSPPSFSHRSSERSPSHSDWRLCRQGNTG